MVQFNGKKGLEMSVNIIVMLVIGLTILGLVISFVTNFLGSAEDQFVGSLSDDDNTKLEQVEREEGNFAFLSGTVNVQKEGDQRSKLYMKLRNPGTTEFSFTPEAGLIPGSGVIGGDNTNPSTFSVSFSKGAGAGDTAPDIYGPVIRLGAGQIQGFPLEVVANEAVQPGVYYAEFNIEINGEGYTQVITIEVE